MNYIKKYTVVAYLLLGIVTLGIYPLYVMYQIGKNTNLICEGDGKKTMNFIAVAFLSVFALFIPLFIWYYRVMERLNDNAYRYGTRAPHKGSDFLIWCLLGSFIFVGPIIAMVYFFAVYNEFPDRYGYMQPAEYTKDMLRRTTLSPTSYQYPPTTDNNNTGNNNTYNNNVNRANKSSRKEPDDGFQGFEMLLESKPSREEPIDGVPPTSGCTEIGRIRCTRGAYAGVDFPLYDEYEMVIGRDTNGVNIVIQDADVSAVHCSVIYSAQNHTYTITDYSKNGTYVNNRRLPQNQPYVVSRGAEFYLCSNQNNKFVVG